MHCYNPHLIKRLPFDINGVQPVTNLFYILQTMVVSADSQGEDA